jgi:SAM-dependent methyltransferase
MSTDPTKRFSNRVDNYVKYRPGYPTEVLTFLRDQFGLNDSSVIADIGSGTGIFTKLLLDQGYTVYAVEPNEEMRTVAENELSVIEKFHSVIGTAEDTNLSSGSIDLIVCAQAFHWFNNEQTRVEFKRILKDDGNVALIWNNRIVEVDEFNIAYDELLKNNSGDYKKVNLKNVIDMDFKVFFKDGKYKVTKYPNIQVFDEAGVIGRAFSSSYVPADGTEEGNEFLVKLKDIFDKYNDAGKVRFQYETEIYSGKF